MPLAAQSKQAKTQTHREKVQANAIAKAIHVNPPTPGVKLVIPIPATPTMNSRQI
jgi:hypothetical protein